MLAIFAQRLTGPLGFLRRNLAALFGKVGNTGKYEILELFELKYAAIFPLILSSLHIFLIVYAHTMQIKYKFHDWFMPQDTADDSWQTLKSFLIIYQVCFNTVFLNIRSFIM